MNNSLESIIPPLPLSSSSSSSSSSSTSDSISIPYAFSCHRLHEDRPEPPKRPRSSNSNLNNDLEHQHCPTPALTPPEPKFPPTTTPADTTTTTANSSNPREVYLLQTEKDRFVNGLVGASVLAIESIWGPSSTTSSSTTQFTTLGGSTSSISQVLPLNYFVREVLRRSRTSCSTLQLSLFYLHKSRQLVRESIQEAKKSREEIRELAVGAKTTTRKDERGDEEEENYYFKDVEDVATNAYPSPPESPEERIEAEEEEEQQQSQGESISDRLTRLLQVQKTPLLCGRRMFLSSLILASKYLQDRNYSNKAWSKISGLSLKEINENELVFLKLIDWELHLKFDDFKRWTERLNCLTTTTTTSTSLTNHSSTSSSQLVPRRGLDRSSSEYLPSPPQFSTSISTSSSTSTGSISANSLRSKLALTRGNSTSQLDFSNSSSFTSSASNLNRSFPIAQPISKNVLQQPHLPAIESATQQEKEQEKKSVVAAVSSQTPSQVSVPTCGVRKVRPLPTRRSRFGGHHHHQVGRIGTSVVVGGNEMISVH